MKYKGLVTSDWNECLAPTGPFDPVSFVYPELKTELRAIFRSYTSNEIPLSQAVGQISLLLPHPFTVEQMDAYLDASFAIYGGVVDMIELLRSNGILFMINTTGAQGFFQRTLFKKLIPEVDFVASNPFIRFPGADGDSRFSFRVLETSDKGINSAAVMQKFGLDPSRVIVIGDSGGDGRHFQWGASVGCYLIGSMTKVSLTKFCAQNHVSINKRFGVTYSESQPRNIEEEYKYNFKELGLFVVDKLK